MKLFGTDGIRGNSSIFPFDDFTLAVIGKSIAESFDPQRQILIICDTRRSRKRIQKELAKGIISAGVTPVFGGIVPTPAASLLVQSGKYSAAIVISASHNPYIDNGIKIFDSKGLKLSDSIEMRIEKKIKKNLSLKAIITDNNVLIKKDSAVLKFYENFIIKKFAGYNLKGKTVVIDCANGASYKSAPYILRKIGAKVIALNANPDGKNINLNCGALHPEYASKIVKEHKAFCGFAFDGDADRLICIDENGTIRDGDYFLAAMAIWLKSKNKLKNDVLITTVMANVGLLKAMKRENIRVVSTKVGDRYVIENITKYKSSFGGEQSGHFIFSDILTTGDGILSAVMLLSALCDTNKTMSEFMNVMDKLPQVLINKKVVEKIPIEKLSKSQKMIKNYEKSLNGYGRVLVRYSGTENLLRIMIEGRDIKKISVIAKNIANTIEEEIESIKRCFAVKNFISPLSE
ncbi:MAG: phosphoglucosamine mutase [Endomicrobium sp.]|jgi:phosphoglucosamine mutase|nr:phosphoglucosamine mutase [Endomicrobium sp.]